MGKDEVERRFGAGVPYGDGKGRGGWTTKDTKQTKQEQKKLNAEMAEVRRGTQRRFHFSCPFDSRRNKSLAKRQLLFSTSFVWFVCFVVSGREMKFQKRSRSKMEILGTSRRRKEEAGGGTTKDTKQTKGEQKNLNAEMAEVRGGTQRGFQFSCSFTSRRNVLLAETGLFFSLSFLV